MTTAAARARAPAPGRRTQILRAVADLLDALAAQTGGALQLPVDVEQVAQLLGLRVCVAEHGIAGRIVSNETGVPMSGLLDFASGRIYVDAREPRTRQRFTIAHEIAHEVLGHEYGLGTGPHVVWAPALQSDSAEPAPYSDSGGPALGSRELEAEADCFAGALLVPADHLAREVERVGPSVPLLARCFGVSAPAMRMHMGALLPQLEDAT